MDYREDFALVRSIRERMEALPPDERKQYARELLQTAGILDDAGELAEQYQPPTPLTDKQKHNRELTLDLLRTLGALRFRVYAIRDEDGRLVDPQDVEEAAQVIAQNEVVNILFKHEPMKGPIVPLARVTLVFGNADYELVSDYVWLKGAAARPTACKQFDDALTEWSKKHV